MELGEILEYFYTGPSFNVESGYLHLQLKSNQQQGIFERTKSYFTSKGDRKLFCVCIAWQLSTGGVGNQNSKASSLSEGCILIVCHYIVNNSPELKANLVAGSIQQFQQQETGAFPFNVTIGMVRIRRKELNAMNTSECKNVLTLL